MPAPVPASWPGLEPESFEPEPVVPLETFEPVEPEIALRPMEPYRPSPNEFDDEPFLTEPAYVDPSPSTMPIPGL